MSDSKEKRGPAGLRVGPLFDSRREKKKWEGLLHTDDLFKLLKDYNITRPIATDKNIAPERMRMIRGFRKNLYKILSKRSFP